MLCLLLWSLVYLCVYSISELLSILLYWLFNALSLQDQNVDANGITFHRIQFSVLRSKHALIEIQLKVDRSLKTRLVRPVLHNCIKTDTPHELKLNLFLDDDVELILFTIFQNSITVSKQ